MVDYHCPEVVLISLIEFWCMSNWLDREQNNHLRSLCFPKIYCAFKLYPIEETKGRLPLFRSELVLFSLIEIRWIISSRFDWEQTNHLRSFCFPKFNELPYIIYGRKQEVDYNCSEEGLVPPMEFLCMSKWVDSEQTNHLRSLCFPKIFRASKMQRSKQMVDYHCSEKVLVPLNEISCMSKRVDSEQMNYLRSLCLPARLI